MGLLGGLEGGVGTGTELVGFCSGSCMVLRFEGALMVGFIRAPLLGLPAQELGAHFFMLRRNALGEI